MLAWYIGPWAWVDDGMPRWQPPTGAAALDLRAPSQIARGGAPGRGIFCIDGAPLDSSYTLLGTGDPAAIVATQRMKDSLPRVNRRAPQGDTLQALLFDALTEGSDPTGTEGPLPLMPTADRQLELHVGPFTYRVPTAEGQHHWTKVCDAIQRGMQPLITAELSRSGDHHRRVLDALCEKYRTQEWQQFVPAVQRKDVPVPLPHATTVTESFNTPDQVGLGPDLSWTSVSGTWEVKSNAATKTAADATTQLARANSDLSAADHYGQAVMTSDAPNDFHGPVARMPSTANATGFCCVNFGGSNFLVRMDSGVQNNLASSAYTLAANDVFKIECNGSTIRCLVNGVQKNIVTDSNHGSNLRCGLMQFMASTNPHMDDFRASDVLSASTRLLNLRRRAFA